MCGRIRLSSDVSEIKLVFSIPPHRPTSNFPPSWNLAPTDPLSVLRNDAKVGESNRAAMRRGLVALGIAIFAASLLFETRSNEAADDTFSNLGEGHTSCGEWLDKRRQIPSRVTPEVAWVLGFLTAASQYHVAGAGARAKVI